MTYISRIQETTLSGRAHFFWRLGVVRTCKINFGVPHRKLIRFDLLLKIYLFETFFFYFFSSLFLSRFEKNSFQQIAFFRVRDATAIPSAHAPSLILTFQLNLICTFASDFPNIDIWFVQIPQLFHRGKNKISEFLHADAWSIEILISGEFMSVTVSRNLFQNFAEKKA